MTLLVIAYGNPSRADDGAGHWLLNRLNETWGLAPVDLLGEPDDKFAVVDGHQVRTMWVQQLDMGLAEDCSLADRVLFLDAHIGDADLVISPVDGEAALGLTSHVLDPATLLHLAQRAYGVAPSGWRCTVRGEVFDFSDRLSSATLARCELMLRALQNGALAPEGPRLA